ncbi:MAG: Rrf2 family transcriptional regulator [Candidatus Omnitrophica bacterium]|nr:Rrf2 family transcriptional regulator [Candidatus Omnitrophota bacterium]
MKLSTKSTYGLRAMLSIAMNSPKGAISVADISKKEGISVAYLEQLLNKLMHRGLVASIRGPKGGYVLSKNTGAITVGDIVKTLEGNIYPVHCIAAGKGSSACKKSSGCVPKLVWMKLAKSISDCLDSITLKELCAEAKKLDRR